MQCLIYPWLVCLLLAVTTSAGADSKPQTHEPGRTHYRAPRALLTPEIDGIADEAAWAQAEWQKVDQLWLGPELSATGFSGRYKVVWAPEKLFVLFEFVDDVLYDGHRDPLVQYWDDDTLEIFIDEDFSGGDHQFNHNAFAYHLSLDNRAIDIGTDQKARDYSHHVQSNWKQSPEGITWEVAIKVYADDYEDDSASNQPVILYPGKIMGLMVAYCDNDGSELRENFIGSESVLSGPKDRGWIDAGLFGALELVDGT